jgi:anti-sigma-K factor RskA
MNTHEQVDQLLAGFAVGGLSERDSAMVRKHLEECDVCAANLQAMAEVVGALPLSVDAVEPPPSLRERVLAIPSKRRGLPFLPQPVRAAIASPFRGGPALRASWALAVVVAIALVAWNVTLQRQLNDTNSKVAQLSGQVQHGALTGASGQGAVAYFGSEKTALISLHDLKALPSDKQYVLWVLPVGGSPEAAGAFQPESDGTKLLVVARSLSGSDTLAVTVEPRDVPPTRPTSTPLMTGRLA